MPSFVPSGNGQQSNLSLEQPMLGYSVTMPLASVIMAKYGTVQLPVINGLPSNVAVDCFPDVGAAVSGTTSPVMVESFGLGDEEDVGIGEAVDVGAGGVRLMLASALDNPAGEHPTKSGAVSFTAAHSCLLNWIATVPPRVNGQQKILDLTDTLPQTTYLFVRHCYTEYTDSMITR